MALSLDPDLRPVLDLARQWDELDRLAERAKARVDARIADLVFERDELAPKTFNARLADLVAERAAAVRDAEAQGAELLARMRALIGAATAPNDVPAPGPLAASKAAADDEDPSDEDDEEGQEGDPPESDATRPWPDSAPAMVLRGLAGLHRPATMKEIASRVANAYGLPLDRVLRRRVRHGVEGLKDRGIVQAAKSSEAGRRSTYSLTSAGKADALRGTTVGEAGPG